ncbi:hypothetical protein RSAG8_05234, partial [Rhizoctonia solani AG-8 WAC10335]
MFESDMMWTGCSNVYNQALGSSMATLHQE